MTASPGLRVENGFGGHADDVYEALIRAHDGLDEAESAALNARLILILANQVGDVGLIRSAIELARGRVTSPGLDPG